MPPPRIGIEALPAALAADRRAAFPHLVRVLQDGVYSGALGLLGNRADAEEITQEAFVRAFRALGTYPPERIAALHLREWVWTIAANLCRNQARRRRRRPEDPLPEAYAFADPTPGPEQQALDSADRRRLRAHLMRLPRPAREAVVLRHLAGLSYQEIAAALGQPLGTVKSEVHRGLERLRRSLEEEP